MKEIHPSNTHYLEKEEKFYALELMKDHVVSRSGKKGSSGREKIHTPKSGFEKNNIRHFANKLLWKKYKEGFYHIGRDDSPLRLQIPTPEHRKGTTFSIVETSAYVVQDSDNNGSILWKVDLQNGSTEKIYENEALIDSFPQTHSQHNKAPPVKRFFSKLNRY